MRKFHYLYLVFALVLTATLIKKIISGSENYKIFNFEANIFVYYLWKIGLIAYLLFYFFKKEKQKQLN